jgi:type II secretory pathway pseudopilin PulG
MVEIALSLAIIGFALVAIIGVLPIGMNVQRENREETIINQDAAVFMDAIRSGARGLDDLTNYVLAIMITRTNGFAGLGNTITYTNRVNPPPSSFALPNQTGFLTTGSNIVGLLSTPKYYGNGTDYWTNHIVAYVRALSGLASEKFPQNNADAQLDAFSYRLIPENVELPVPPDYGTNSANSSARQLTHNLHELRLLFRWPQLASGKTGNGRQVFRTTVGGMLTNDPPGGLTWFFQPQTYVKAP